MVTFYRRRRIERLDQFLVAFHRDAPLLFWMFALALGAAFALGLLVLREALS